VAEAGYWRGSDVELIVVLVRSAALTPLGGCFFHHNQALPRSRFRPSNRLRRRWAS